jgi:hypothetical protein
VLSLEKRADRFSARELEPGGSRPVAPARQRGWLLQRCTPLPPARCIQRGPDSLPFLAPTDSSNPSIGQFVLCCSKKRQSCSFHRQIDHSGHRRANQS